eukprot:scaffold6152_cov49-Phaeocystis_antarctica.AAC.2
MSAAAAPAPPGISVCSAPTCQPIAACTIGADVGSWKEVERVFKEADLVNKRMKAGSRMQRHAQRAEVFSHATHPVAPWTSTA